MSYKVETYNVASGWKVGDFISKAATEAAAEAEAVTRHGIGDQYLNFFRHVLTLVEAPEAKPEPAPEPAPEPESDPVDAEVDKLASALQDVDPGLLAKLFVKLNNGLAG